MKQEFESAIQQELYDAMSSYSEASWCAGWLLDWEFVVWKEIKYRHFDWEEIHWIVEILRCAVLAGGWIYTRDDPQVFSPRFVSFDEWANIVASRRK